MIEGNKRVIVFIGNYWLSIYGNRLSIQRDKGQFLWLKEPEKLVENKGELPYVILTFRKATAVQKVLRLAAFGLWIPGWMAVPGSKISAYIQRHLKKTRT